MKLCIVSDLHLGDPACVLVERDRSRPEGWRLGSTYDAFRDAVGPARCDYLILVGDVFDLSIANYTEAYGAAQVFLQAVNRDELTKEIIYLAGNHDFSVFSTFVHQRNVINRIRNHKLPTNYWTVPGVIDDRPGAARRLVLPDVRPNPPPGPTYAGLFLDELSRIPAGPGGQPAEKPGLPVNFAYPNLYLVDAQGSHWLITHGHYFEDFWCFGSRTATRVAWDDLDLFPDGQNLTLDELVGFNLPFSELNSASLGQAGRLTSIFLRLHREVRRGDFSRMAKYIQRGFAWRGTSPWYMLPVRRAADLALDLGRLAVLRHVKSRFEYRDDPDFLHRPTIRANLETFYRSSLNEIQRLRSHHKRPQPDLPDPHHIIFGHSHYAIPLHKQVTVEIDDRPLHCVNTGAWLRFRGHDPERPIGAVVFTYETDSGFRSQLL